jgi:hypothetical protein
MDKYRFIIIGIIYFTELRQIRYKKCFVFFVGTSFVIKSHVHVRKHYACSGAVSGWLSVSVSVSTSALASARSLRSNSRTISV